MDHKALRLSAALAYYAVFSIAPLLVITLGIAGIFWRHDAARGQLYTNQLYDQLQSFVGTQAAGAIRAMVESASGQSKGKLATVIGFVILMFGASGVFGELKDALNTIWGVKPKPGAGVKGLVRDKLLNFGMVLVIGFLLLVSLVLSAAVAALSHQLEFVLPMPPWAWVCVSSLLSFVTVAVLFAMIFKILPDAKIRWGDVVVGATITAFLFELGKTGLAWYLGRESTTHAYGAAGSVVLLLLWIYYASCILFFGAEFTQVFAQARGHTIVPTAYAKALSVTDFLNQGMEPGATKDIDREP